MGTYTKLCEKLVENVGGAGNIAKVEHCMTRLRFELKDEGKANDGAVKNIDGVTSLVKAGGQYQVVIGSHVDRVYEDMVELLGGAPSGDGEKKSFKDAAFSFISNLTIRYIMILVACSILSAVNIISTNLGIYTNESIVYTFLNALGNTVMYFMPVFVAWSAAVGLKMDPALGIAIGAAMMHPNISGVELNVFGNVVTNTYSSTFLPAIVTVLVAWPFNRFFKKHIPGIVNSMFTPMLTLLIAVPIGFFLVGPISNWVGNVIGGALNGLIAISPVIGGALIGGLYEVCVVFGIHGVVSVPSITNVMSGVPDSFGAMRAGACFACAFAALAVYLRTKDVKLKEISLPAFVSGMFGVTEPALYGIMINRLRVFAAVCIGGAAGGAVAGMLGAKAYGVGSGGVFQFVGYINPDDPAGSLFAIVASFVVCAVVAFVAALALFNENENTDALARHDKSGKANMTENELSHLAAPFSGNAKTLDKVSDDVFAQGTLGKGIAVEVTGGEVVAPADATVTSIAATGHAIGLTTPDGAEVLIHVGIDTVKLEGRHFDVKVAMGDDVKRGDLLITFDREAIRNAGYSLESVMVVSNSADYADVVEMADGPVRAGDDLLALMK